MKKRHVVFYKVVRPIIIAFLKIAFGYKYKKAENLPENYIVLSNHATDFDPLFVAASFPKHMYFIASEHIARWNFASKLIEFFLNPIMRYKGAPATTAILEMMRRVKKGSNVAMFAEGVRTWDGVTCPILPATGKLVKSSGCGLVTYRLRGGYFASPMWAGASIRRGGVYGAPVHVYTPEQLKSMSAAQINEAIVTDLYEDAYARQKKGMRKYRGKNLAKGLEHAVFICPECGKHDTFSSDRNKVYCSHCGFSLEYDLYGMFDSEKYGTVKDILDWEKRELRHMAEGGEVLTAKSATLSTVCQHKVESVDAGKLFIGDAGIRCGEFCATMDDVTDIAMHGRKAIVFTAENVYYELIPQGDVSALRLYLYFCMCKELHTAK